MIDSIFEVRLPTLFLILREYHNYEEEYQKAEVQTSSTSKEAQKDVNLEVVGAEDDEDDEDFMDDPVTMPKFEETKMMDLEVADAGTILSGYEELMQETESLLNELFEVEVVAVDNNVQPTEAIQEELGGDLEFFDKLNTDIQLYK